MSVWKNTRPVILAISIALNVAFLGTWALHVYRARRTMHRAHSGSKRRRPEGDRKGIWCPFHREIGVTEEQWQELEPSLREFQEKSEANARRIRKYRDALMDELRAPEPDMERIEEYREKIAEGQSKMHQLVIERLLEQKKVLTPEQQERLFKMLKEKMGSPAGRRRPPGTESDAGDSLVPFAGILRLCHTPWTVRPGHVHPRHEGLNRGCEAAGSHHVAGRRGVHDLDKRAGNGLFSFVSRPLIPSRVRR